MRVAPSSQAGFTLIEVLVSLALMAMIGTILVASLQIGGHSWQRVKRAASNTEDVAQAQQFLRRHLSSAYPLVQASAHEARAGSFFLSDGQSIEFSSAAPDSSADGVWRYYVAVSDTGMLEVKSRRDFRGSLDTLPSDWASENLLSRAKSLAVQFWLKPPDLPGRWVDHWTDHNNLPRLIRIDVTFAPDDSREWPTLYIEPRVDTPVNCEFDVVSRNCRSGA